MGVRRTNCVRIGSWSSDSGRVYVIAEAGSNHDRKLEQAKQLIDAAAEAGADAVKFQAFNADRIVSRKGKLAEYLREKYGDEKTMNDLFRELELPRGWLPELSGYARQAGLDFLCTPFDEEAVDLLEAPDVNVPAHKIATFELWHLPLIDHAARTGKPIILSTGMASLGDIEDALDTVAAAGGEQVMLMHCVIGYPAPYESMNLRAMDTMRAAFGVPVGLSDHSSGVAMAIAAAARGAACIEKHYTISRELPGPDHPFALEPDELKEMIAGIRAVEQALGTGRKERASTEDVFYVEVRRSLFAACDIPKGTRITAEMLTVLRPGTGLKPKYASAVIGRTAGVDIAEHDPITWDRLA